MRFEFVAGALCLDFANTIHDSRAEDRGEELQGISDLLQWAREAGLTSAADHARLAAAYRRDPRKAAAALATATTVRDLLLSLFGGIADGRAIDRQVADLNAALAKVPGILRVRRTSAAFQTEWGSSSDGMQRLLFPVLTSAADLLASDRLGRVRACAGANCTWLFVDASRNRSRRWCDMAACGNRMKARRYYQRSRSAQPNRRSGSPR